MPTPRNRCFPHSRVFVPLLLLLAAACGDDDSVVDPPASGGSGGTGTGGSATGGSRAGAAGATTAGTSGRGGQSTGGTRAAGAGGQSDTGGAGGEPSFDLGVDLGAAEDYVVIAKSGISTVPTSAITGDLGVSPAAATYVTGFSLTLDATEAFSTSPQVTGRVYAADYASPTPAAMTKAVGDMEQAFTDASGRAPGTTELGAGDIGGLVLAPGVYKWGTGLLIPSDVTLRGSSESVWIFQIAQDLTVESGAKVVLAGGARAKHVFWQVSGQVDLGTTAHFEGIVLAKTSVTLRTGASINGRLLAQTAVSLDSSTLIEPAD
jgi:hypothetical protein